MEVASAHQTQEDRLGGAAALADRGPWPLGHRWSAAFLSALVFTAAPASARAADGCTVLLCLAGNWRNISQCVPPVRQALRDLMLGRGFPVCGFASAPSYSITLPASSGAAAANGVPAPTVPASSQATLRWAEGDFCPPQYRTIIEGESTSTSLCAFAGAIEVTIGGQLWNRTWWSMTGDSVTEWTSAARASMPQASADDRFERDYEAWRAEQSSSAPAPTPVPQPEGGA